MPDTQCWGPWLGKCEIYLLFAITTVINHQLITSGFLNKITHQISPCLRTWHFTLLTKHSLLPCFQLFKIILLYSYEFFSVYSLLFSSSWMKGKSLLKNSTKLNYLPLYDLLIKVISKSNCFYDIYLEVLYSSKYFLKHSRNIIFAMIFMFRLCDYFN